jgi:hypothetical protein
MRYGLILGGHFPVRYRTAPGQKNAWKDPPLFARSIGGECMAGCPCRRKGASRMAILHDGRRDGDGLMVADAHFRHCSDQRGGRLLRKALIPS